MYDIEHCKHLWVVYPVRVNPPKRLQLCVKCIFWRDCLNLAELGFERSETAQIWFSIHKNYVQSKMTLGSSLHYCLSLADKSRLCEESSGSEQAEILLKWTNLFGNNHIEPDVFFAGLRLCSCWDTTGTSVSLAPEEQNIGLWLMDSVVLPAMRLSNSKSSPLILLQQTSCVSTLPSEVEQLSV